MLFTLLLTAMAILASIPLLHLLASTLHSPLLTFLARFTASVIALAICASYGVVASIGLRLVGYGGLSQYTVARAFKYTMLLLTGVTFSVSDPSHALATRPAVLVGNHQSELDVLMLGCVFPPYTSVTSKDSLKWVPLLGWFMLLSKTVFINRGNNKEARAVFDGAANTIRGERQNVFIFPEGTRSYAREPRLLPFKKGAFHLAVKAQVPVVPVVVANYSGVLDVKRRIFNKGDIPVRVLEPISTEGMTMEDVGELTAKVQRLMEEELVRITAVAQQRGIAVQGKPATGVKEAIRT